MTDVEVVLDTSAVLAYVAGSTGLGELLGEFLLEGQRFAVPATALIEAAGMLEDAAWPMLDLLVSHKAAVVTGVDAGEWRNHASSALMFGGAGNGAAAFMVAQGLAWYVVTGQPDVYGDGIDTVAIAD